MRKTKNVKLYNLIIINIIEKKEKIENFYFYLRKSLIT